MPIDAVRSRQEVAEILGISTRTLSRLEVSGQMPPRVRVSDRRFGYRDSAINKFIAEREGA